MIKKDERAWVSLWRLESWVTEEFFVCLKFFWWIKQQNHRVSLSPLAWVWATSPPITSGVYSQGSRIQTLLQVEWLSQSRATLSECTTLVLGPSTLSWMHDTSECLNYYRETSEYESIDWVSDSGRAKWWCGNTLNSMVGEPCTHSISSSVNLLVILRC